MKRKGGGAELRLLLLLLYTARWHIFINLIFTLLRTKGCNVNTWNMDKIRNKFINRRSKTEVFFHAKCTHVALTQREAQFQTTLATNSVWWWNLCCPLHKFSAKLFQFPTIIPNPCNYVAEKRFPSTSFNDQILQTSHWSSQTEISKKNSTVERNAASTAWKSIGILSQFSWVMIVANDGRPKHVTIYIILNLLNS